MPARKLAPEAWRAAIPADLRASKCWVGHRDKRPVHPVTGADARVNDPSTWGTFEEACAYYERTYKDPTCGCGHVFTGGITAVDLDHMVTAQQDEYGHVTKVEWRPEAHEVQAMFADVATYAELSPGGGGVHVFVRGELPAGTLHQRKVAGDMKLEVWDRARYVTVTGVRLNKFPIAPHPPLLAAVVSYVGRRPEETTPVAAEPERAAEVEAALKFLDPDMTHPDWVKVGMALKAGLGPAGLPLWVAWSKRGEKYVEGEPERVWASFQRSGIGLGSVLFMAKEAGWKPPESVAREPEEAFKSYTPEEAEDRLRGRIVPASQVKCEDIDWLWTGRVAVGQLYVVAGDPGQGKSIMMLDIGVRITRGWPLPGETSGRKPGGVLLLDAEDHPGAVTRKRLEAAGADLDRVYILDVGKSQLTLPSEAGLLRYAIQKFKDISLVVMDPFATVLDPGLDSNSMSDVRRALDALAIVGAQTKVSPGVIHHLNKGSDRSGLNRLAGSVGIGAAARYVMVVGPDPEDPDSQVRHVGVLKSNGVIVPTLQFVVEDAYVPPSTQKVGKVRWLGESNLSGRKLTEPPEKGAASKTDECKAWLESKLASGGEVPARVLFEEAKPQGWNERLVQRCADALHVVKEKSGPGGAFMWRKA